MTVYGIPGHSHDRLPDNSLEAVQAWHAREDAWLTEARAIDPTTVKSESLRATNAIVREALEGAVGSRLCRTELWPVSQMAGWQTQFGYLVTIQPVKTAAARQQALARWGSLPRYLDVEIDNLREGVRAGYTSPRHIVRIVIDQIDGLIKASAASGPVADSPFHSPSERDDDPAFKAEFDRLVTERLVPAFRSIVTSWRTSTCRLSRETIGLSELPDGAACYDALVRQFSSLPMPAAEVYALGERQMNSLMAEMRTVAERSIQDDRCPGVVEGASDRAPLPVQGSRGSHRLYESRGRTGEGCRPGWFGLLPSADVVIEPYPEVPREERAERIQSAGRRWQPSGALLHQRVSGREKEPRR